MSSTSRTDGLLGDLQQLTDAGRDRVLTLLPREDVIAVLKAALRERDREHVAKQTQRNRNDHVEPINAANRTVSTAIPENRKRPRVDEGHTQVAENKTKPVAIKKEHETIDLDSDDDDDDDVFYDSKAFVQPETPIKRDNSPSAQNHARSRGSSTLVAIPQEEQTQTIGPPVAQVEFGGSVHQGPVALPHETHETPAVPADLGSSGQDGLPASPNHVISQWAQANPITVIDHNDPSTNNQNYLRHMPAYALIHEDNGNQFYKSFVDLPPAVQHGLNRRFRNIWTSRPWAIANCKAILENPDPYMAMPICVPGLIIWGTGNLGRAGYSFGGRLKETADDWCVRARHPCVHFIKCGFGKVNLCFVPLPPAKRVGKVWTELSYWVDVGVIENEAMG